MRAGSLSRENYRSWGIVFKSIEKPQPKASQTTTTLKNETYSLEFLQKLYFALLKYVIFLLN